jgi:hypothetical protein
MDKQQIISSIDSENGAGFYKNIKMDGYTFYKNNSFILFKMMKVEDVYIVNIRYIYADNIVDLLNLLAFCANFWVGMKVKFIYYSEKEKAPYVLKALSNLNFTVERKNDVKWEDNFKCLYHQGECKCQKIEIYK